MFPTWFLVSGLLIAIIHESRIWVQMIYEIGQIEEQKQEEKNREHELNEITRHMYI